MIKIKVRKRTKVAKKHKTKFTKDNINAKTSMLQNSFFLILFYFCFHFIYIFLFNLLINLRFSKCMTEFSVFEHLYYHWYTKITERQRLKILNKIYTLFTFFSCSGSIEEWNLSKILKTFRSLSFQCRGNKTLIIFFIKIFI